MSLLIDPDKDQTENENVLGTGEHVFETNMPAGATWTSGLTVKVDIQSPYPGDEDQWETLHTFSSKDSWNVNMISGRIYRVVASAVGPWVFLNVVESRVRK